PAHLALCPLCAAKFKELVKKDDGQAGQLRARLLSDDGLRIPIRLGKESAGIRFVEKHWWDVQALLTEEQEAGE
ncbi:MAG: hypothetical protein WAO20_17360, partial [Acidobacteriota bacterium]